MQLQFLPYHHEGVTRVHRVALFADIGLTWYFWPLIRQKTRSWTRVTWAISGNAAALYLSWFVATFPGEPLDRAAVQKLPWLFALRDMKTGGAVSPSESTRFATIHEMLFTETGADASGIPGALFNNTLVLRDFHAIDQDLLEKIEKRENGQPSQPGMGERTIDIRGRNFKNADFSNIDLRRADLTNAILDGALLFGAQMQGAALVRAQMQGALIFNAQMQGASLDGAQMQGASLDGAQMQGASLGAAQIQGASLDGAQMQGASLGAAQMQGASLDGARMQGASLVRAQIQGASFESGAVWRNDGPPNGVALSLLTGLRQDHVLKSHYSGKTAILRFRYERLLRDAIKGVPENRQEAVKQRLAILDPAVKEPEDAVKWTSLQANSASPEKYPSILAEVLDGIACDGDNAPYVARAIIGTSISWFHTRLKAVGPAALPLIDKMLAPGNPDCPGAVGLGKDKLAILRFIKQQYMSGGK
jgi:uncharacterized protein YjbI with pentapeptide repeats